MGEDIPHEVHAAALPGGVEDLRDRSLDPLMGVGDHQLNPAQAAPGQLAQESRPEGLGLGRTDIHAKDFPPAIGIGADRDNDRH